MKGSILEQLLLLDQATVQQIEQGQTLFCLGDPCVHYVILKNGSIRVELLSQSGQQLLLYRINSGQSCVMTTSCLLGRSDYFAQATCETDIELIILPKSVFEHQLNVSADFRDFVFNGFAERLASLLGRTAELTTSTVDQRLAAVLIATAECSQLGTSINLTHNELAIEIGSSREVVSRRLAVFEKKLLIERRRGHIELLDKVKLSAMCSIL